MGHCRTKSIRKGQPSGRHRPPSSPEGIGADATDAIKLIDGRYPGAYPDFGAFLDAYLLANSFVSTPEDLEFVAAEFARGQPPKTSSTRRQSSRR